jgi:glutamate synthase domain-containing protein 2
MTMSILPWWIFGGVAAILALLAYDLMQKRHAILRNFPLVGHLRYILEAFGPELRQYIVTDNDEERPFSRDQRRWVYTSAKRENNYFGFGTDNDLELSSNYLIIKHQTLPAAAPDGFEGEQHDYPIPCAKVIGAHRGRKGAFRPASIINTSAMSFGSLSGPAVEAINRGCAIAGCMQNTGEGGISDHHRQGGDLIFQFGTGYFGCRNTKGEFSLDRLKETLASAPVKMIEVKLSQGAKPGLGGILPAAKVTPEIAAIRGIEAGKTVYSPTSHSAFSDESSLLDFVEMLADETGLPVGIKSAVGELDFWNRLAHEMATTGRAVDFIAVDGGEGGTGAGPLAFTDHVSMPFKIGFTRVYREMAEQGLHDKLVFMGAGKLGFPQSAIYALGLGCDMIAVAREAMLAVGCIQAQKCHTGHCPTGVATQQRWLVRGLDPTDKAARMANYVITLRQDLLKLAHACGQVHPALVTADRFEVLDDHFGSRTPAEMFGYAPDWGLPGIQDREIIKGLMGARS